MFIDNIIVHLPEQMRENSLCRRHASTGKTPEKTSTATKRTQAMTKHKHYCLHFLVLMFMLLSAGATTQAQLLSKGKASYYSDFLHGMKMSNGIPYHRDSMTCAHLSLPFGTLLKVHNLRNGREVVVEVTDRGPFCKKYILDLSRAAAKKLGILGRGYAPVEVSLYVPCEPPFRLPEEEIKIPEPEWEYTIVAVCPEPVWQQEDFEEEE